MASKKFILSVSALAAAAVLAATGLSSADEATSENAPIGTCLTADWDAETDNSHLQTVQAFFGEYEDVSVKISGGVGRTADAETEIKPGEYLLNVLENAKTADGQAFRICIGEKETATELPQTQASVNGLDARNQAFYNRSSQASELIHANADKLEAFIREHLFSDPSGPFSLDTDTGVLTISPEFFDGDVTNRASAAFLEAGKALTYELQALDFETKGKARYSINTPPGVYTFTEAMAAHGGQSVAAEIFAVAASSNNARIDNYASFYYSGSDGKFVDAVAPSSGSPLYVIGEAFDDIAAYETGLFGRCVTGSFNTRPDVSEYGRIVGLDNTFNPFAGRGRGGYDLSRDRFLGPQMSHSQTLMQGIISYTTEKNKELPREVQQEAHDLMVEIVEGFGNQTVLDQVKAIPVEQAVPQLANFYINNIVAEHLRRLTDSTLRYLAGPQACGTFEQEYPGQPVAQR